MSWNFSNLRSLLYCQCPQCHSGDLFVERNAYRLRRMADMNSKCTVCDEDFQREPGFYFGAAYVSYALTVALWVAVLVALTTFDAVGLIEFGFYTHVVTFLTVRHHVPFGAIAFDLSNKQIHLDSHVCQTEVARKKTSKKSKGSLR